MSAAVCEIADALGATPSQVSLAWLLEINPNVVPIPGTKRRRYLEENLAAAAIKMTAGDVEKLIHVTQGASGARESSWISGNK